LTNKPEMMLVLSARIIVLKAKEKGRAVGSVAAQLEARDGKRREIDQDGIGSALPGPMLRMAPPPIADIAAAIGFGVGVQDFLVKTGGADSQAVVSPDDRRGIDNKRERLVAALA
jgi:hypothetical protein